MLRFLAVPLCALVLSGATVEDGQAWIKRAEELLYRWPAPNALVRFEAHTDVLAPMIAAMKADLAGKPDAEGERFVAALEQATLHGSIDTRTGKVETDFRFDCPDCDPRSKKAVDTIRQRMQLTLAGCFASLPLHDPNLLRKGAKVDAAEEREKELLITSQGTVVHLARGTGLPSSFEMPQMALGLTYTEIQPGRFVPASVDVTSKLMPASHAEFTWQRAGELWFPEHVQLSSKGVQAKIDFDHLVIEPRQR